MGKLSVQKVAAAAVLIMCSCSSAANGQVTYAFKSNVQEHKEIDLDVKDISALAKEFKFQEAKEIYENGKNSAKTPPTLRNLKSFSTGIDAKIEGIQNPAAGATLAPEYNEAKAYWGGSATYADNFVVSAFDGTGNAEGLDNETRAQLAIKGIQYQVVSMYVLYELAKAISLCYSNTDGLLNWDEGAAFFIGSLINADFTNGQDGQLQYTLAQKRCGSFQTCADSGQADANVAAINALNAGQQAIIDKQCATALSEYQKFVVQLQIPLIQGTLLYAWRSDPANGGAGQTKLMAEAWAFVAGILPMMDTADSANAQQIRNILEMKTGVTQTVELNQHQAVFTSMYSVMEKMCISCEDIGISTTIAFDQELRQVPECVTNRDYFVENCDREFESKANAGLIAGVVICGLVVIGLMVFALCYISRPSKQEEDTDASGIEIPEDASTDEKEKSTERLPSTTSLAEA